VKIATGRQLPSGSPCAIEAALEGDGGTITVKHLTVACGGAVLYDSAAKLNGMSMSGSGVEEEAGEADGTNRYAIAYQDKGTRSGARTEVSINSSASVGSVWSDNAPAFRVDLAVSEQADAAGDPLLDLTGQVLRRAAVATSSEGAAPARKGARCAIRVTPMPERRGDGQRCRTRLTCGKDILYGRGTSGFAVCTLAGQRVVRVTDKAPTSEDQDPMIDVDAEAGTVKLSDIVGKSGWSVAFELEPR
jgi:hypothetical protein